MKNILIVFDKSSLHKCFNSVKLSVFKVLKIIMLIRIHNMSNILRFNWRKLLKYNSINCFCFNCLCMFLSFDKFPLNQHRKSYLKVSRSNCTCVSNSSIKAKSKIHQNYNICYSYPFSHYFTFPQHLQQIIKSIHHKILTFCSSFLLFTFRNFTIPLSLNFIQTCS